MTPDAMSNGSTTEAGLRDLLQRVADGRADADAALAALRQLPFEDLGYAKLDHHRELRTGAPEAVYCEGKSPEQVAGIVKTFADRSDRLLGTRATPEQFDAAAAAVEGLQYDDRARCLWLDREPDRLRKPGVAVVCAGTSDLPVAEEAAITLDLLGHEPLRITDVGVAGVHRLLAHIDTLREATAIIAVAGMEGAMPGVLGGLVGAPIIAVPTSVGYGASFGGVAALLGMLNACASGIAVVNIDNGFGAAQLAARINRQTVSA